ncbi:MAG: hypothetical protein K9I94_05045 [Bacteroidales bacterium]|nr:hypothetical protein [Bacteroidales bacterium]
MILKLILIGTVLLALAMAGIGIKLLVKKDGEFKHTCGSVDPITGERVGCSCGNSTQEDSSCSTSKYTKPLEVE